MKRAWTISLIVLGILLIVLGMTRPNEDDYKAWLAEKHGILCEVGGPGQIMVCTRGEHAIEWHSKHVRSLPFYMQVEDKYSEGNKAFTIRAFGILNSFFNQSDFNAAD